MATRVTLPASRFAPVQEARHGQPSVIGDVGQKEYDLLHHQRWFQTRPDESI
jgi:hypothetical protein